MAVTIDCISAKSAGLQPIHHLSERIAQMQAMQRSLQTLVSCCKGNDRPDCPILDDLAGAGLGATSPPVGMLQR